jgi:hypothetical protein
MTRMTHCGHRPDRNLAVQHLLPDRCVLSFRSDARETLGSETAQLHHAAWRRGSVAARGACAAGRDAGDRVSRRCVVRRLLGTCARISARFKRSRSARSSLYATMLVSSEPTNSSQHVLSASITANLFSTGIFPEGTLSIRSRNRDTPLTGILFCPLSSSRF